ncbi:MAG: ZIP family metal transporter [Peptococcaceae bacterium]|nr:ZIP family metal transporter [Peptococcaceae bacterium]
MLLYLSTIAGLATPIGCLIVLLLGQPSEKLFASLLAGAGGVMLAVISLDLIPAALSYHLPLQFLLGFFLGIIFMSLSEKMLQHRYQGSRTNRRTRLKMVGLLIASGIALHDIPEGMAIAVGQEATGQLGMIIAVGITLHNLPEGMATATPLLMAGIRKTKILALNLAIAFFTPLGAILGKLAIDLVHNSLCLLLSLAAGAMTFLVLTELIPLAKENHPRQALMGGLCGYIFFVFLSLFL